MTANMTTAPSATSSARYATYGVSRARTLRSITSRSSCSLIATLRSSIAPCARHAAFRSSSSIRSSIVSGVVCERGPQLVLDAAQLRAHVRCGDAEDVGDLRVVVVVEVEQHQRLVERAQLLDAAQQQLDVAARRGLGRRDG